MSIALVLCTERAFEHKSLLMLRSLRRFGGGIGLRAPVFSYAPRPELRPSDECLREFAGLAVEAVFGVVNPRPGYAFGNKVVACRHAASAVDAETIIFIDSDQLVLRPLDALRLAPDIDAAARPVDRKHVGCAGEGDPFEPYWTHLYRIAGATPGRTVETTLGHEVIWEYFNGGLIAMRRSSGVIEHYYEVTEQVIAAGIYPRDDVTFVEQSAFAAAVTAKARQVAILPPGYNYPLTPWEEWRLDPAGVSGATTLHYHRAFDQGGWRALTQEEGLPLDPSQRAWLRFNIEELGF